VVEQGAGAQAEHPDQPQQREAAAGFLGSGLRVSALVLRGIGQTGRGAVDDFDAKVAPEVASFLRVGGGGATQAGQNIPRQASAGLTVATGAFIDVAVLVQGKKGLDLPDDLAAGTIGIEHLVEETKEGAPDAENAFSAVGAFLGLRQQGWRQEAAQELVQVEETLVAQADYPLAHGTEAVSPVGEEGCVHGTVLILCTA
jgi:hypothetical protein